MGATLEAQDTQVNQDELFYFDHLIQKNIFDLGFFPTRVSYLDCLSKLNF